MTVDFEELRVVRGYIDCGWQPPSGRCFLSFTNGWTRSHGQEEPHGLLYGEEVWRYGRLMASQ